MKTIAPRSTMTHDCELVVYCQSGQRSYYACCLLRQSGFRARNLTGGYRTFGHATSAKTE